MDLCERIDEARERWNVLRHPFYTRWERGELTQDELGFYAGEYRHAVVALAETASAAGDAEHAREEAEHVGLWDAFAATLDAPLDRDATTETAACARAWSRRDRLEALAVLYAVESSQPAISETKLRGLVEHYGFRPDTDGVLRAPRRARQGARPRGPPGPRRRSARRHGATRRSRGGRAARQLAPPRRGRTSGRGIRHRLRCPLMT
jgi:pyrroloquinoline quinone (PQQ) biosynthesis protein C